jgi:hypothetical protein
MFVTRGVVFRRITNYLSLLAQLESFEKFVSGGICCKKLEV